MLDDRGAGGQACGFWSGSATCSVFLEGSHTDTELLGDCRRRVPAGAPEDRGGEDRGGDGCPHALGSSGRGAKPCEGSGEGAACLPASGQHGGHHCPHSELF